MVNVVSPTQHKLLLKIAASLVVWYGGALFGLLLASFACLLEGRPTFEGGQRWDVKCHQ
jgi:hypothetical protein